MIIYCRNFERAIFAGSNVARLCYKARVPVSEKLLGALEFQRKEPFTTAAVCVYPARIADAVAAIQKMSMTSYIPVAAGMIKFLIVLYFQFWI